MPATQSAEPVRPHQRLYVNIDHVATLREARRGDQPDPLVAAMICEAAGADGITAHLREDRRHIQDQDVSNIAATISTVLNLEIACTAEMLAIAERLRPHQVTLVPERREEVTTEGGLDLSRHPAELRNALARLAAAGIRTSLFIDPEPDSALRAHDLGAAAIELHTGRYSLASGDPAALAALAASAAAGADLGMAVHAGHGLTARNLGPVAALAEVEELNVGHSIISRAIFLGLESAVREIRAAMSAARDPQP